MQLAAAALFAITAVVSVVSSVIFINHDNMLKAIQAQGTSIPQGTSVDTVVNFAVAFAIGAVIFFAILDLVAALGSYLGWRWMFWAALILFGFGGIGSLTNLSSLAHPATTPMPTSAILLSELISLAELAMFIWLLVGLVKFGPWAMKKPGR